MKVNKIDKLNLATLLSNPVGTNTTFAFNREMVKDKLYENYIKLIKEHKDFKHDIYRYKDNFIFHFQIPSESYADKKLYYDVVLEFVPKTSDSLEKKSINTDYEIHFFSNSPAFMFTYAFVLFHNNMSVDWLDKHLSREAIKNPPKERNPVQTFGFEKTCYYAALYIKNHNLFEKDILIRESKLIKDRDLNKIFKEIMSCEDKLDQYNKFKAQQVKYNKEEKKKKVKAQISANNKIAERNKNRKNARSMKANMKTNMKANMKANMSLKKKK